MQNRFMVAASPHDRGRASTRVVMSDVCLALLPAGLVSIWFFGLRVAVLIALSVASAVIAEWYYQRRAHKPSSVGDWSAVVTGLLLAYNLPASAPWWMPVVGSAVAIVLVKQFFGGLGQNFMNPALAARAILVASWGGLMAACVVPQGGQLLAGWSTEALDTVAKATPLAVNLADPSKSGVVYSLWDLLIGNVPGTLGETGKLALLLGGAYLLLRRVITWHIPVCFICSFFLLTWIQSGNFYSASAGADSALYQALSGGLLLGAIFMATDYSSSPATVGGKIVYGLCCGVILFLFRAYHARMSEGCCYTILLMNILTPLIERATKPRAFGEVKQRA
jgi:electron transport complex protein RnfD